MRRSGHIGTFGLCAVVAGLFAVACSPNPSQGPSTSPNVMVKEVRVMFDPRPLPAADITASLSNKKAVEGSRQFQELLVAGFRDRFPGLAAKYGLMVTAGASYQLSVKTAWQYTRCYFSCWSRVTLMARLVDLSASGKEVWTFETKAAQAVGPNGSSEAAFDPIAEEILQALKKAGIVGR